MNVYLAEIVSDKSSEKTVNVEASSLRVAFTKAARHAAMSHWARVKVTFVRKVIFEWILIVHEADQRNPAWSNWVPHPEHGKFDSAAIAMQHASTVMGIGHAELCKYKARRVRRDA